jgi:hypothetical protein
MVIRRRNGFPSAENGLFIAQGLERILQSLIHQFLAIEAKHRTDSIKRGTRQNNTDEDP